VYLNAQFLTLVSVHTGGVVGQSVEPSLNLAHGAAPPVQEPCDVSKQTMFAAQSVSTAHVAPTTHSRVTSGVHGGSVGQSTVLGAHATPGHAVPPTTLQSYPFWHSAAVVQVVPALAAAEANAQAKPVRMATRTGRLVLHMGNLLGTERFNCSPLQSRSQTHRVHAGATASL
jgi:hypothetical protein